MKINKIPSFSSSFLNLNGAKKKRMEKCLKRCQRK